MAAYAAEHANGPGAIYVGDLSQLPGPAPIRELGDGDGQVSLGVLQRHSWIYESDYYRSLLEKAWPAEPAQLTSDGDAINLKIACASNMFLPCQLLKSHFVPNVSERTNGQIRFEVSSYAELGLGGFEALGPGIRRYH